LANIILHKNSQLQKIVSISQLIKSIKDSEWKAIDQILENLAIPLEAFDEFQKWKTEGYSRNYIYKSEEFELLLVCWNKNNASVIHDHGGQKCWVYQLDGEIMENRYDLDDNLNLKRTMTHVYKKGDYSFMDESMGFHNLANTSTDRAVTLHVYMSPILSCNVYDSGACMVSHKNLDCQSENNNEVLFNSN